VRHVPIGEKRLCRRRDGQVLERAHAPSCRLHALHYVLERARPLSRFEELRFEHFRVELRNTLDKGGWLEENISTDLIGGRR
jgi:hypothetical protein